MLITAKISDFDGERLTLLPDSPITQELIHKQAGVVELRIVDGREITADQRKKIYAIFREVALWSGHYPEEVKEILKYDFRVERNIRLFSLSDVDETTAHDFIDYLIAFCLRWDVPTKKPLIEHCDDVDAYLWNCLWYRKCSICGRDAEVHHVDRIGMGRDREKIVHEGLRAIALCREHHDRAHRDERKLFEQYHLHGIRLDAKLCGRLSLRGEEDE